MSYLPPEQVKQGFWIDESKGYVLGATLTTTSTTANVLVAFLAVLVSTGLVHAWDLILFAIYQLRAREQADGLFYQQQAILRTLANPERTILDLCKVGFAWRGKARKNLARSLIPAAGAALFALLTLAASIFTSYLVTTKNVPVLATGDRCGDAINIRTALTRDTNLAYTYKAYLSNSAAQALSYAQSCYVNSTTATAAAPECDRYVVPNLPFTKTKSPCPFAKHMCNGTRDDDPAITMDTGLLDSSTMFGINSKESDRVQVRKKTSCVPIATKGYWTTLNAKLFAADAPRAILPQEQVFVWYYGDPSISDGISHILSTYASNTTTGYFMVAEGDGPGEWKERSVTPLMEDLSLHNADTVLIYVHSNDVLNTEPVDDPIFSAHQAQNFYTNVYHSKKLKKSTYYSADEPAGVVGCAEQYQFCINTPNGQACTELGGAPSFPNLAKSFPQASEFQMALLEVFVYSMYGIDVGLLDYMYYQPLTPAGTIQNGFQSYHMKNDQWEIEVNLWVSLALSMVQKMFTDHNIGPKSVPGQPFDSKSFQGPTTPYESQVCQSQKMKSEGGFSNINVFGLAFTVVVAGLLVIADLLVLRVFIFATKYRTGLAPGVDRWIQDGVLQLQRKAYEGQGEGNWQDLDKEIPTTKLGDKLSDFPFHFAPTRSATFATIKSVNSGSTTKNEAVTKTVSLDSSSDEQKEAVPAVPGIPLPPPPPAANQTQQDDVGTLV